MDKDQLKASNLSPKVWNSEVMVSVTGEPPGTIEGDEETARVTGMEIIPECGEPPLSLLDVLRITAVLEDARDQLSILNHIMPVQVERSQGTSLKSTEKNLEGKSIEKSQMISATLKTSGPIFPMEGLKFPEISQGGQFVVDSNKMQDLVFKKPTRQTIMTTETLKKIQIDRQFFSDVITHTMQELEDSGTFTILLQTLGKERENKTHFYNIIASEEKGRKQIKSLQKQLLNVKKERQVEVQSQNEYIAHLKDQLQEIKAKTNMESCYTKKNTELQIAQAHKKFNKAEELLLEEIEKLRMKTEEENWIHTEIETFLKKEQQPYLSPSKLSNKQRSQRKLSFITQVALSNDEVSVPKIFSPITQAIQCSLSSIVHISLTSLFQLQAWWRGTVIRHEIGSFKMPKKDKDDSKDSKGKGKDKEKRRGKK
ncbi:dynein regulatory complex protein 9 [Trichechus manatus latirostris]|uniref:Dynein regulatory complex protein 9 n=1 Tax=Trichechus manatus latirostris TaxID=127582 RepID=A0A2Y9QR18_TRIMA|nr:dynein regulatory complex protein 9 [Trichechus manatus latirostris]